MMKLRRLMVVSLVTAVGLTLAGCVGSNPSSSGNGGQAAADLAIPPPPDTKATLNVWYYFDPTAKPTMQKLEDLFHAKYPNVKVNYLYVDFANMRNKVLTAAASKQGPDVLLLDPMDADVLVKAGALADLTSGWKKFDGKGQYPDFALKKVDEKLYSVQAYVNTTALWYNADILKKIGVAPPTTSDELGTALAKAKAAGYQGFALCGKPTNECETQATSWILGNGGNYDDLGSPNVKEVFTQFSDWAAKGYIPREAVNWDHPTASQKFASGKYAFVQAGNWDLGVVGKGLDFKWGVVPLPGGKVAPGGEGEAIGAFSKNKRLAWQYLASTFWSKDGQVIFANGRGSIPVRPDASKDPSVSQIPHIGAWVKEIAVAGSRSPATNGDLQKATQTMGEVWSGILSGQLSPDQAEQRLKSEVAPIF